MHRHCMLIRRLKHNVSTASSSMVMHAPSIVPAIMADEWTDLLARIHTVKEFAQTIHIDVMDGVLVPSFSFPYNTTMLTGEALPESDTHIYEVHLMVQHPQEVGERFLDIGAHRIIAQVEGFRKGRSETVLSQWSTRGEVGVALMLDTPIEMVFPFVDSGYVSVVQVMSIARIGYQGELFDDRAYERIKQLRMRYPALSIAVDGGINVEIARAVTEAGASQLNVGSFIMHADNPNVAYETLQNALQ